MLSTQTVTDGLAGHLGVQSTPTDSPWLEIVVAALYLVYTLWTLVRPRRVLWSRWRFTYTYLLSILVLTLIVGSFASSLLRLLGYSVIFCMATQARAAFGRVGSWLVIAGLLLMVLLDTLVMSGVANESLSVWTPLQLALLLIGLAFVQTFTGLGVQERTARMQNEELVAQLTQAQEQLRKYALHAEELATMRERTRVAREIHDTLAQGLAAIKMHLETGQVLLNTAPTSAREHIEYARSLAGTHLHEARTSILELRTDALQGQSLTEALTTLTASWRGLQTTGQQGATFRVGQSVDETTLSSATTLTLYRVTQEALHNARQHGHASAVEVELSIEAEMLCLTLTDNGIGFEPATAHHGFGIVGMRERLHLLQGTLDILSTPGAGTQVVAMVPLQKVSETEKILVGIDLSRPFRSYII
jgi:signal transduction histidine kinase